MSSEKFVMAAALHEGGHSSGGGATPVVAQDGDTSQEGSSQTDASQRPKSPLHLPALHESGYLHVSGHAIYVDDIPAPRDMLVGMVVPSPIARGKLLKCDTTAAKKVPGVAAVLTASDIPGHNDIAPFTHDEPLLATDEVFAVGQSVAFVVADSYATCRKAAAAIELEWAELPAVVTLRDAVAQGTFLTEPHIMKRGDVAQVLAEAPLRLQGEVESGGQDHFYLETHAAFAIPEEDNTYKIVSLNPASLRSPGQSCRSSGHSQPRCGGGSEANGRWFWWQRNTGRNLCSSRCARCLVHRSTCQSVAQPRPGHDPNRQTSPVLFSL